MMTPSRLCLIALVALAFAPAAAKVCDWSNPGTDKYTGDPSSAVDRLAEVPADVRDVLRAKIKAGLGRMVLIGRDQVDGGRLVNLRSMNFGGGRICDGPVDRSAWTSGRLEQAMSYEDRGYAVLHVKSCNNVTLATDTTYIAPADAKSAFDAQRAQASEPQLWFGTGPGLIAPQQTDESAVATAVPEPGSLALLALAGLAGWITRRE